MKFVSKLNKGASTKISSIPGDVIFYEKEEASAYNHSHLWKSTNEATHNGPYSRHFSQKSKVDTKEGFLFLSQQMCGHEKHLTSVIQMQSRHNRGFPLALTTNVWTQRAFDFRYTDAKPTMETGRNGKNVIDDENAFKNLLFHRIYVP